MVRFTTVVHSLKEMLFDSSELFVVFSGIFHVFMFFPPISDGFFRVFPLISDGSTMVQATPRLPAKLAVVEAQIADQRQIFGDLRRELLLAPELQRHNPQLVTNNSNSN